MPEEVIAEPVDISTVLNEVEIPETTTDTEDNDSEQVDSDVEPQVDSDESEEDEVSDDKQVSDNKTNKKTTKSTDILKTDFKSLPAKIKTALKENPELKATYFQAKEYAKSFATPEIAQQVSETLDLYGGIDAIKSDMEEFSTTDTMFAAGDPALIDKWAEMSPSGFAKIVPEALNKLYNVDPEMYQHVGSKMIASYLNQQNGLVQSMTQYYNTLPKDSSEAKLLNSIYSNFLEPILEMSKKVPEKKVDPERLKLNAEKEQWNDQKVRAKNDEWLGEATKNQNAKISDSLKDYIKGKNITDEQIKLLSSNIDARAKKMMMKNPEIMKQMKTLLSMDDKTKFIKYMNSKIEKFVPAATHDIWKMFNGVKGTSKSTPVKEIAKTTAKTTAPILINRIPKPSEIDREATEKLAASQNKTYNSMISSNTVVLKNGKIVKW